MGDEGTMSEQTMTQVETPSMNPLARIVNVFVAPSKTFEDVKRSSGWWVPFLIAAVIGLSYSFVLLHKVGMQALVEGVIQQSPALETRISAGTPEQAAAMRHGVEMQFKFLYVGPVISLLVGLAASGLLLATANFGAGGKAKYSQMMGVWFYGTLPLTLFYLLVMAAIYGGVASDPFNIKNPIGTNVGFYLMGGDMSKMLIAALSAVDIFAIWTAFVLAIGVSTVAEIKRGAAAAVVCVWWFVFVMLQVAGAAFS
jgi:hypothetical protein